MTNCAGIFQGAIIDCVNPLPVGTVQRVLIANREDVESITYDATPNLENVITGITMKTGKQFFEFAGVNESIKVQSELIRRAVSNGYKHQLDFNVFEVDNLAKQNLEAMAYKKQVAIAYGADDTGFGNGAFELLGPELGLDVITNIRINGDVETGGSFQTQLATPDSGGDEKKFPPVIWNTDYQITLAIVDALLIPAI